MNIIDINGSPRKNGNKATLLEYELQGAQSQGTNTERIDLYNINYKGCISCFYCKRKDKTHGICAVNDDLTPVLKKIKRGLCSAFGLSYLL